MPHQASVRSRIRLWTAAIAIAALALGASFSATPALADEPSSAVPTLSVSKTSGLDRAGESITVTGTNYVLNTAGFYVQIGYIDAAWKPSEGAPAAARSTAATVWVQGDNDGGSYLKWTDNGDGTVGFSWTTTITKAHHLALSPEVNFRKVVATTSVAMATARKR